jgi:hypothetical protein
MRLRGALCPGSEAFAIVGMTAFFIGGRPRHVDRYGPKTD